MYRTHTLSLMLFGASLGLPHLAIADNENPNGDDRIESTLYFTNKNSLSGNPIGFNQENKIIFSSPKLIQSAKFDSKNLISLQLHNSAPAKNEPITTRVKIAKRYSDDISGDTITGELHELTPEAIKIKTWYGGVITIQRAMVQSLSMVRNLPGYFQGPNSLKEWHITGRRNAWSYEDGTIQSNAAGLISRDVKLAEKSHIRFNYKWQSSRRLTFRLFAKAVEDNTSTSYYELSLQSNNFSVRTVDGNQNFNFGRMRGQNIEIPNLEKQSTFDIFADGKQGIFTIFIDGKRACMLQSKAIDVENIGGAIAFISEQNYPTIVSDIEIKPWNGISLPNNADDIILSPLELEENKEKQGVSPHEIILLNGDIIPGEIGKVKEGKLFINTELSPIQIPVDRIDSINLSLGEEPEQPMMQAGDVRCLLHSGGYITLKLNSLENGKIRGYNQAVGDVVLDLSAFYRVDFFPYEKNRHILRKEVLTN